MALCKTGTGVTDIRGGIGGVYFTRDKSGLHCSAKPRRVKQRTISQDAQRRLFVQARNFSTDPRVVSYNIYRLYLGLEPADPPPEYTISTL